MLDARLCSGSINSTSSGGWWPSQRVLGETATSSTMEAVSLESDEDGWGELVSSSFLMLSTLSCSCVSGDSGARDISIVSSSRQSLICIPESIESGSEGDAIDGESTGLLFSVPSSSGGWDEKTEKGPAVVVAAGLIADFSTVVRARATSSSVIGAQATLSNVRISIIHEKTVLVLFCMKS